MNWLQIGLFGKIEHILRQTQVFTMLRWPAETSQSTSGWLRTGFLQVVISNFFCESPYMGVSENRINPIVPNGFADHYPYEKWLFHWEY